MDAFSSHFGIPGCIYSIENLKKFSFIDVYRVHNIKKNYYQLAVNLSNTI